MNWGLQVFKAISSIKVDMNITELQEAIVRLENCKKCSKMKANGCRTIEFCTDLFRVLLNISPHYQRLRTLLRRLYEIRSLNIWLLKCDTVLNSNSLEKLEEFVQFDYAKVG